MKIKEIKRNYYQLMMYIIRSNKKKANFIRKHKIFHRIGKDVYYTTNLIPSEPYLISIHNNVIISAGVRLITHSVEHAIFNIQDNTHDYYTKFGKIEIHDNVYIGANAIIMPGVTINKNCVIAAGAVVTKDVEENSVIAGVPAKKIMSYNQLKKKSLLWSKKFLGTTNTNVDNLIKIHQIQFDDSEDQ